MSNVQVFSFDESVVRTNVDADGVIWFCARDVAACIEHSNAAEMLRVVEESETNQVLVPNSRSEMRKTPFVSESGLYRILFRSDLPKCKPFQNWLAKEALPSIRKTGRYETPTALPTACGALQPAADALQFARVALEFAKSAGLKDNFAILAADQATRKLTDNRYSPVALLGMQLIEERKEPILTPTEIGMRLEPQLSAIKVNQRLAERGFQIKPTGATKWEPTDAGKEYAELIATGKNQSNGAPILQLKWRESIAEHLK